MEKHRGRSNDPQLSPHLHNTAKKIPPHAKKSRHHDPHRRQKSLIFISCKRVHLISEHEYQEKKLKVTTRYNILNFPALFSVLAVEQQRPGGQNAGLTVLKLDGKIQKVVSSSDFEIFSPEMHALARFARNMMQIAIF